MILALAVLTTALLFGGMTLYSFGFAAFFVHRPSSQDSWRMSAPCLSDVLHICDRHVRRRCAFLAAKQYYICGGNGRRCAHNCSH